MDDVSRAIASGRIDPAYVLVGEEAFRLGAWVDAIRLAVLGPEGDPWSSETFDGPETSAARVLAAARTVPFLGGRRLVLVRGADAFSADDQVAIAEYLAAPSPTTTLVLVAAKLDGRSRLTAEARRLGFLHRADPLRDREAGAFVSERAAARGMRLEPRAAQFLVELLGADAASLDDALERLALYLGEPRAVTAADVEACVAPHRQVQVFALVDAISQGDAKGALTALASLRRDREPALLLLWWLARQVRQLAVARTQRGAGDVAGALGVPPFVAEKLHRQAKRWNEGALRSALGLLAQADLDLKGSKIPEGILLEALVLSLARKARTATSASARPR